MSERDDFEFSAQPPQAGRPGGARLGPDDRYERAAATEARARSNKPEHLVMIAAVLFVVACGAFGYAWHARARAATNLAADTRNLATIEDKLVEYFRLVREAEQSRDGEGPAEWIVENPTEPLVAIERIGVAAGLEPDSWVPQRSRTRQPGGYIEASYEYTLTDNNLTELLAFVRDVLDPNAEPRKMRLNEIILEPERRQNVWRMRVEFARYEAAS